MTKREREAVMSFLRKVVFVTVSFLGVFSSASRVLLASTQHSNRASSGNLVSKTSQDDSIDDRYDEKPTTI